MISDVQGQSPCWRDSEVARNSQEVYWGISSGMVDRETTTVWERGKSDAYFPNVSQMGGQKHRRYCDRGTQTGTDLKRT